MGCGHGRKSGRSRRRRGETYGYSPHNTDTTTRTSLVIPRVPQKCSNCGAIIEPEEIKWTGPATVECPYCGYQLQVELERIE